MSTSVRPLDERHHAAVPADAGAPSPESVRAEREPNGRFGPGNSAATKHGIYSASAKTRAYDLQPSVEGFVDGILADMGGDENLSTIARSYIEVLRDVEICRRMLLSDMVQRGIFTPRGRTRATFSRFLETVDRWDRIAQRIGTKRSPKHVNPIDALRAAVNEANQR